MQKERRTFKRMSVNMSIRFFSEKSHYTATVVDCTKNGIGINTYCNCLPCSYKVDLLVPLDKDILKMKGKISRIQKISDVSYGIGIELLKPPQKYLDFIDNLGGTITV
jgi:hypothetical protein